MVSGHFSEAFRIQTAGEGARTQMLDSLKRRCQRELQEEISAREQRSRAEYEQFQREMRRREQEMEAKFTEQAEVLWQRQGRELEAHDDAWKVEPKLRQYNRASQQLRILRIQQRLLVATKRYEEAGQVCGIADRLARADAAERHYRMSNDYHASKELLERKHEEEIDTFQVTCGTRRGEFAFLRETLGRRFANRLSNLQTEALSARDPEKVWVRKHRFDGGDVLARVCGGTRKRTGIVKRRVDVNEFNVLPLPPLPVRGAKRRGRTVPSGITGA
jgi:hypothetical protein